MDISFIYLRGAEYWLSDLLTWSISGYAFLLLSELLLTENGKQSCNRQIMEITLPQIIDNPFFNFSEF